MNRIGFLKSLGLGASGLILPANGLINTKSVKIYDNYIRGLMHYNFKEIKNNIQEGDEVQLMREPANIYDSFAIQVNRGDKRLGYLAAYENIVLANMMDVGIGLRAYVSQKNLKCSRNGWRLKSLQSWLFPVNNWWIVCSLITVRMMQQTYIGWEKCSWHT